MGYDTVEDGGKAKATNVCAPGGGPVQGELGAGAMPAPAAVAEGKHLRTLAAGLTRRCARKSELAF